MNINRQAIKIITDAHKEIASSRVRDARFMESECGKIKESRASSRAQARMDEIRAAIRKKPR